MICPQCLSDLAVILIKPKLGWCLRCHRLIYCLTHILHGSV